MNCFTPLLNVWEIPKLLKSAFMHILNNISKYQTDSSGLILDMIRSISVIKADHLPLAGASDTCDLNFLNNRQKGSVINHPSKNEKCFANAVAAGLLHKSENKYQAHDQTCLDTKIEEL